MIEESESRNGPRELILAWTDRLVASQSNGDERYRAAIELETLLSGLAALDPTDDDVADLALACGSAISPARAARCARDAVRTAKFLGGLGAAVAELLDRCEDRPVHVLYAGCGPLATLAAPLACRYGPDLLTFTLVDVHPSSIAAARRVFDALGRTDSLIGSHVVDASDYEHDGARIDVLVVETMGVALMGEPQVAVTRRLAPLLGHAGVLVPGLVRVSACLADVGREQAIARDATPDRVELGTVFELSRESAVADALPANGTFPAFGCDVVIPSTRSDLWVTLRTEVEVFPSFVLAERESEITMPLTLFDLGRVEAGDRIAFRYVADRQPGLRWKRISTTPSPREATDT